MQNQVQIVLPLPPPGSGDGETSMDPTQHSAVETGMSTEKATEKSSRRGSAEEVGSSKEIGSSKEQTHTSTAPESFRSPQVQQELKKDESTNTSRAQNSTTESRVLQKTTENSSAMVTFTSGSVTTTTAPISAGVTPRIARKIPVKQPPPPVLPPPPVAPPALPDLAAAPLATAKPTGASQMNTPTGGVRTASETTDAVIRSENLGSICDEDAGYTPLGTPQSSMTATNIGTGAPAQSTAASSRLTSFTPSQSTSGTLGRPI